MSSDTSSPVTSRMPGFYRQSIEARLAQVEATGLLSPDSIARLRAWSPIDPEVADRMSENVVGCQGLPLSLALNFRVNGRDVIVPMAVEEPSIVAAASNAARLVRMSGGFTGEAQKPLMTAQIQLEELDAGALAPKVLEHEDELLAIGDGSIPRMVARGGGCRRIRARAIATDMLVVEVDIDVGEAMGANIVDTVAEAVAPRVRELTGGRLGLRILTNLPLGRMVRASARVSAGALGGDELADGIVSASRFAELDVFRAVTHNKGVMNGVDAVAVALGQDWRSIEAAAHAFASLEGRYKPIATWRRTLDGIEGQIELPLAVGTVGGSTAAHHGVRTAFELIAVSGARELAVVMAAVGLASNLAALKALAGEGIQKGHMRLHHRKSEPQTEGDARMSGGRR